MSFQPVVPIAGYAGWRFLERTVETQKAAFVESPVIQRATDYFRENIGTVFTAEALVEDRRLLEVALGAFGLDDDINSKAFVQEILSEGTLDDEALANRLTDDRYRQFAEAFGFGDIGPRTVLSGFATEIISRYETKQFEIAVGEQNSDMRLALGLGNDLSQIFEQDLSNDGAWYTMMGNPPLRQVFETALGFPTSFGLIDVEDQLEQFQDRAESVFGTSDFGAFADPEMQDDLIRLYMLRSELNQIGSLDTGSVALTLLQSSQLVLG